MKTLTLTCAVVMMTSLAHAGSSTNQTETEAFVNYTISNAPTGYYLMDDGRICAGMRREGKHVIWTNACLEKSQYMYGGPQCRIPLIKGKDVDFQAEASPKELVRTVIQKR